MGAEIVEGVQIGRYTLLTRLARGGMANVWLARADGAGGFQKIVVIKTILPHLADDPEFVSMFIDEALVASKLEHPNIVQIFDLGEVGGSYFIAMEYIAGHTLRQVQRELRKTHRVLPPWLVLHVASATCEGLTYAHTLKDDMGHPVALVHRDISPENIMVSVAGETKILDFGIAKASNVASKTQVGVLKGKYAYMAPEQIEGSLAGSPPDARADVYSLGVLMYELITGRRPYRADNELALMRLILGGQAAPPHDFCNWVSSSLSALVMKAMAANPEQRFLSTRELRLAIDDYFRAVPSAPNNRNVADYLRSLFGEPSEELSRLGSRAPADGSRDSTDPWDTDSVVSGLVNSVTFDLALVLSSDDEMAGQPAGGATSEFPVSSLGVPSSLRGATLAKLAGPLDSTPTAAVTTDHVDPPAPPAETEHRLAMPPPAMPTAPGDSPGQPPERRHVWDLLTTRARKKKWERPASDAKVALEEEAMPKEGHNWDAVVGRAHAKPVKTPEAPPVVTREGEGRALFEEGLSRWRNKDFKGTLESWTRALELDPDNRSYQSNLRMLKRQLKSRQEDH